jgi:hypothetical protein
MSNNRILGKHAQEYRQLAKRLHHLPLLAQGNVFAIDPPNDAPRASTHYKWTRKVKGKTVTEALSQEQFEALSAAIAANREVEQTLQRMRSLTQEAIMRSLPDSPGKRARKSS